MFKLLLFFVVTTNCLPLEEKEYDTTDPNVVQLQKEVNIVSYIQNFKEIMAEYVNSQYKNLTTTEFEEVKSTLEDFLKGFADDLKEALEKQQRGAPEDEFVGEKVEDTDTTFYEIKYRLTTEFPDINDTTANEIVFKLRKNLYATRAKLDFIIRNSQEAQMVNS